MIQELTVYAVVVCTIIGIMLILCVDVINRTRPVKLSIKKEIKMDIEPSDAMYEKNLAFPFYVDCSQSSHNDRIEL